MYKDYQEFDAATGFSDKAGFQLKSLQIEDVEAFVKWQCSLNAMDVGCGKTVVSTVTSLMRGDLVEATVVIVPPILIPPWLKWLRKVSERALEYRGTKRELTHDLFPKARWIVMSHAIFRKDAMKIMQVLNNTKVELIADEAHAIKNVESHLHQYVSLFAAGNFCQLLTGTPTSTPADSYAYIKLKTPTVYRSYGHFEMLHVGSKDHFKRVEEWKNLDLLAENFAKQTIKRTKEEVHGYSIKPIYPDCSYRLSPKHQALYDKLMEEQLLLLDDGTKIDATTMQKLYYMSQQIIVNWAHFGGDETLRPAAYDLLDLTIEQTECNNKSKSKLIVWTYYKMSSRRTWDYLKAKGIKTVAAYSEVNSAKSVEAFMEDEDTRIIVGQRTSMGVGLNPQHVCWETLALETPTSVIQITQADGRVDRVGQLHTPTVRYGVADNTVQVALLNQLVKNEDLVAKVEGNKARLRDILLGRG